jgi:hypothetical protein
MRLRELRPDAQARDPPTRVSRGEVAFAGSRETGHTIAGPASEKLRREQNTCLAATVGTQMLRLVVTVLNRSALQSKRKPVSGANHL